MPVATLSFTLGSVTFAGIEVPEHLPVAIEHAIAERDYPGGTRLQQTFGSFPEPIKWTGWLMGVNALDRLDELAGLADQGNDVQLRYGGMRWDGKLKKFTAHVRNQWTVQYEAEYAPRRKLDTQSAPALTLIGLYNEAAPILDLHMIALQGLLDGQDSLGSLVQAYAVPLLGPIGDLVVGTQALIAATAGQPQTAGVSDLAALSAQAQAVQQAASPFIAAGNPLSAAPAAQAYSRAAGIMAAFSLVQAPVRQIEVINPSLPRIAATYLGDAMQWQTIASYNNLPLDPHPVGDFTLNIPPPA